jgi:hypothetical protein
LCTLAFAPLDKVSAFFLFLFVSFLQASGVHSVGTNRDKPNVQVHAHNLFFVSSVSLKLWWKR